MPMISHVQSIDNDLLLFQTKKSQNWPRYVNIAINGHVPKFGPFLAKYQYLIGAINLYYSLSNLWTAMSI